MHFHISSSNSKGAKLKWQEEKLLNSNTWWKSWGKMTNYIVVKLKQQQSQAVSGVRKKQKWQEPENFCRWLGLKITESVVEKLDELMQYSGATSFQSAQDDWCNFRTQLIPWQRSNFPTTTTDESIVQLWSCTKRIGGFGSQRKNTKSCDKKKMIYSM